MTESHEMDVDQGPDESWYQDFVNHSVNSGGGIMSRVRAHGDGGEARGMGRGNPGSAVRMRQLRGLGRKLTTMDFEPMEVGGGSSKIIEGFSRGFGRGRGGPTRKPNKFTEKFY